MKGPRTGRLYQHKKGGIYEVLMLTFDTETEETRVVYKDATLKSTINWDRPLALFTDGRFQEIKGSGAVRAKQRSERVRYFIAGYIAAFLTLAVLLGAWFLYLAANMHIA